MFPNSLYLLTRSVVIRLPVILQVGSLGAERFNYELNVAGILILVQVNYMYHDLFSRILTSTNVCMIVIQTVYKMIKTITILHKKKALNRALHTKTVLLYAHHSPFILF